MLTTHLFRYTSESTISYSRIFKIFFASGGKGALTPVTKILRTFLVVAHKGQASSEDQAHHTTTTVRPHYFSRADTALHFEQWRRQRGEGGKLPPYGWTSKNYVIYVCAFIVMELLRITRQIHCKAVEQRATLIHRQYNRDWGTSYSRPPIDSYITPPCYKILAAPLQMLYES